VSASANINSPCPQFLQADEVLASNSKRDFVIIQDKRKDGEIWVSLKQQEV
jgi:hypothetical protein